MKTIQSACTVLLFFSHFISSQCQAQISPDKLRSGFSAYSKNQEKQLEEFYTQRSQQPLWYGPDGNNNRHTLRIALSAAADMGLHYEDYNFSNRDALLNNSISLRTLEDSIRAELNLSLAAIHFYGDVSQGNIQPPLQYNGWNNSTPAQLPPVQFLTRRIRESRLLPNYNPDEQNRFRHELSALTARLKVIRDMMAERGFRELTVTGKKLHFSNKPLLLKLYQLGYLDAEDTLSNISEPALKKALKEAQYDFNLTAGGLLNNYTLKQLNIPLAKRQEMLSLSINYYRWLAFSSGNEPVIVVNIPATTLKVYGMNTQPFEMRIIAGKKSTPTPTLTSTVDEVILYPYWHVPFSIATKEILPILKRNPGYINDGNYQVLNQSGKVVDPFSINWKALSASHFPYTIRQSTGCDNSLGLLKLNFYNPFSVYLHDTPNKKLFMLGQRFFSHGCMRMEKPMELGRLLLEENHIAIDTLEEKGCLLNQAPISVKLSHPIKVIVWYNPVQTDQNGRIIYYEDVYGKLH